MKDVTDILLVSFFEAVCFTHDKFCDDWMNWTGDIRERKKRRETNLKKK